MRGLPARWSAGTEGGAEGVTPLPGACAGVCGVALVPATAPGTKGVTRICYTLTRRAHSALSHTGDTEDGGKNETR